jgi:hypothetical protein
MKITNINFSMNQAAVYRIQVQGRLGEEWSSWFDGMTITAGEQDGGSVVTTLTGPVVDQAALHGLLSRIRDLNLPLLLVEFVESSR